LSNASKMLKEILMFSMVKYHFPWHALSVGHITFLLAVQWLTCLTGYSTG